MIAHKPLSDTKVVAEYYSERDGVPVVYVGTTALDSSTKPVDVFFRETPHPKFGNRYFGFFFDRFGAMICNADKVEELEFVCALKNGSWTYSRHRHDFVEVDGGALDGGRAYTRIVGDVKTTRNFIVKDGQWKEANYALHY
jgi:hypothetical protein